MYTIASTMRSENFTGFRACALGHLAAQLSGAPQRQSSTARACSHIVPLFQHFIYLLFLFLLLFVNFCGHFQYAAHKN